MSVSWLITPRQQVLGTEPLELTESRCSLAQLQQASLQEYTLNQADFMSSRAKLAIEEG